MLKILSGDHQFFRKSLGIKLLYDRVKEMFRLLTGEAFSIFSKIIDRGSDRATYQRGTLTE